MFADTPHLVNGFTHTATRTQKFYKAGGDLTQSDATKDLRPTLINSLPPAAALQRVTLKHWMQEMN